MTIRPAETDSDYEVAKSLIIEYTKWLDEDFCTHRFDEEMADIRSMYGPPEGTLLLAIDDGGEAVGCIGYRKLAEGVCEMKRLYVVPSARGQQVGRKLVLMLLDCARDAGYRQMQLDTLPKLATAIALYREIGFVEIEPYYYNPIPGVTYLSLDLVPDSVSS